ncbi:MAG TPA: zonular occludens toxin domain-containing protein [Methylophilaceae bacterium]|nr:zonular occludens toxin domain-containing protein [Methylophilaceae bacterium]
MPLLAYIGLQGNGKTYEVVTVLILEALMAGRRVVSNIAGLNYDLMFSIAVERGTPPDKVGELVNLDHHFIMKPDFWITDHYLEQHGDDVYKTTTIIHPGDLVALDEIWRFWDGFAPKDSEGNKRPPSVLNFLRMHRHMTNDKTGLCCEIAIITQDLGDIHRSFKNVIDQTFVMTKHTALGSTKRYRVDIYQRYNTRRKPINSLQKSYDPKLFELYSSHSQAKEGAATPKEQRIDTRGNLLSGKRFVLFIPLFLIGMIFSIYKLNQFFHPETKHADQTQPVGIPAPGETAVAANVLPQAVVPEPKTTWRILGYYQLGNDLTLVMRNDQGITRYVVSPSNIRLAGLDIGAILDNDAYSNWTGSTLNTQPGKP